MPDKNTEVYRRIFAQRGTEPKSAAMVGNSLKSDIVPVLELGAWGIFVPHALTWSLEHVEAPVDHQRFRQIENLKALPELLSRLP